ncbi:MAG TPA: NAD-binding protein, partial [Marmoricola sp.]|nr:NAD-binding protein [Marmoricola sp.]
GIQPSVLREAGINDADMLIACAPADETNLVACKVAHDVFNVPTTIARIRSPEFEQDSALLNKDNGFAVDQLICPEQSVTAYVRKLIEYPEALAQEWFHPDRKAESTQLVSSNQTDSPDWIVPPRPDYLPPAGHRNQEHLSMRIWRMIPEQLVRRFGQQQPKRSGQTQRISFLVPEHQFTGQPVVWGAGPAGSQSRRAGTRPNPPGHTREFRSTISAEQGARFTTAQTTGSGKQIQPGSNQPARPMHGVMVRCLGQLAKSTQSPPVDHRL